MMKIVALLLLAIVAAYAAPLLHTSNENVIPGSYIVILNDDLELTDRDAHILTLKDQFDNVEENEIGFTYNVNGMMGFSARLSKTMLQQQLAHSNVKYIEADQIMSINYKQEARLPEALATQSGSTWGISRVSRQSLPYGNTYTYNTIAGSGVDVYVIDTGILTTHTDFGGRATAVYNAITNEASNDLNGHGTHCAGTIGGTVYGVAKQVALKAVKVLSASGSGSNAGVIAGVNYVANNKSGTRKSVASMSLGGGASQALDDAVTNAVTKGGVSFVAAAGNDNANACNSSPARAPAAITVGATANTDARSSFSNFGTCVNIFAPGTSITSTWIGSNTATNTISGTSMACPHVAGGVALAWSQDTGKDAAGIRSAVLAVATPGKVTNPGTGSPNFLLFTNPK